MTGIFLIYVLVLLLAIWNGVARELRNGMIGYLLQTLLVAVLYVVQAIRFDAVGMWVALTGLVVVRGILIPFVLRWKLETPTLEDRRSSYVLLPAYMLIAFAGVALLGLGTMEVLGGVLAGAFGAALATLLIGLTAVALSHDAGKQIIGLLTADNGVDLAVVTVLSSVSALSDYVVFVDIAIAVGLLVVLMLKFKQTGSLSINDYHELKG